MAAHARVYHLGAHAPLADEQPLVDQVLDGLPHRRAGQAELVGQRDLVLQAAAGRHLTGFDHLLQPLCHLEVQRHRAGAVDPDRRGHALHDVSSLGRPSDDLDIMQLRSLRELTSK